METRPGFRLHIVPDDGTCMFRSIYEAYHQGLTHTERDIENGVLWLKSQIQARVCRSHSMKNFFAGRNIGLNSPGAAAANALSFEAYCRPRSRLFDTGFYGGEVELIAAAHVLRVAIFVHHARGPAYDRAYYPSSHPEKEIHLMYNGTNHYNWLSRASTSRASSSSSRSSYESVGQQHLHQANHISGNYLRNLGLPASELPAIRNHFRSLPFNHPGQFLRNHGYDAAARHADARILAHMVMARHAHRHHEKSRLFSAST